MDQGSTVTEVFRTAKRDAAPAPVSLAIWVIVAAISVTAALSTALSETGRDRIAGLFSSPAPDSASPRAERRVDEELSEVAAQLSRLRSEIRLLGLENQALATKIQRLEADSAPVVTAGLAEPDRARPAEPGARETYPPLPGGDGAAPAAGQRFVLEIGSGATVDELRELWRALSARHRDVLEALDPAFQVLAGEEGERRLVLRAGPLAGEEQANSACDLMKTRGAACSPVAERNAARSLR